MCLMPCTVVSAFSILRATSVSNCDGDAPGRAAITVTVGTSMSGKFWTFMPEKPISPPIVMRMKARMTGTGLRMAHEETFMFIACPRC